MNREHHRQVGRGVGRPAPGWRRAAPDRRRWPGGAASGRCSRARRGRSTRPAAGHGSVARWASSVSIITLPTTVIASRGQPVAAQVRGRVVGGRQQDGRELVGEDPVDLLGHRSIERAQPGLDVRDRDAPLGGDQRGGERRVDVSDHDDEVGALRPAAPARSASSPRRSARRGCRCRRAGRGREPAGRGRRRTRRPCADRSAGRCGPAAARRRGARGAPRMIGAILTKFGRAPTTWRIRGIPRMVHERWRRAGRPRRRARGWSAVGDQATG